MQKVAAGSAFLVLLALAYYLGDYRNLAVSLMAMLALLLVLEARYPRDRLGRKTMHFLGGGGAAFLIILAGAKIASGIFAVTTILLVVISKLLKKGIYVPLFSEGTKNFEREGVPPLYGTINFLLGGALTTVLFPPYAAVGMLVLGTGDAFSTVIGMNFGRTKIGKKSIEGTLAFFAVSFVACAQILPLWGAAVAALAGAVIELLPISIDDNITIPLGVAAILSLAV